MKNKIGFRAIVIIIFLLIFYTSFYFYNKYTIKKIVKLNKIVNSIDLDFSELKFQTLSDRLKARKITQKFLNFKMGLSIIQTEIKVYSGIFILLLIITAGMTFYFIFKKITKPLKELEIATNKIRDGNFSITLPETGIKELKNLKQSFNSMSNQLEQTQKKIIAFEKEIMWKELSRILAHEIKNPLTPIQLSLQRLEEKYYYDKDKFDDIFKESLDISYQEIDNLRKLVQSFSNFAKIEHPEKIIINIKEELNNIIKSYTTYYKIELISDEDLYVFFDQTHFYQIITNITQNAISASKNNEPIIISTQKSNNHIILSIKDQGEGIKSKYLNKIFDPYFTLKKKGTGLGLALVKRLTEINSAVIRVHSKENIGTNFELIMEENNENSNCR